MIPHEFHSQREMSRTGAELFRKRTTRMVVYSHVMKACAGPCRRSRSAGQFIGGDTFCKQCRIRSTP